MNKCQKNSGKTLSMIRGDSATFHFHREDADGKVIITTPQEIYFTVKASFDDAGFVIQKRLADMTVDSVGEYSFTILPTDTNALDFGEYVYDLEVVRNAEATDKQTISKGIFELETEVTYAINEEGE